MFAKDLVNGLKLTKENFKTPPVDMSILPFWFWNGEMEEEEMEWQLKEYKDKGIPGLFIHGRFGEKLGYLSDKWMDKVKFCVEKSKEIGIDAWVYDEMNWPSGTAERQVLEKYPHLKQRYLELVALQVDGPLFTFLEATDDRYVNTGNSKPIAAFACSHKEFTSKISSIIDLTPNLSFNAVIPWEAPKGTWMLMYFLEKEVPYYIDALNPESTNKFIELTHEKYKKAVGKDFGSVVPGFYTDEPAMHYYHVGMNNYIIPWSSQMFKIFKERRGYDLKPYLPALYVNMGEKTAQIRYDFWRTLTEQYAETYFKRLHDWCEDNGVLFTGHTLFEELLRLQARCEGNIFKYLKHMHIVGVDHLYPKIGTKNEPDQHVALKLGSSAAHHFGSTRLLCESMGGTYWDCTLERMKWIANWEYVLGVNLFNNHGYHYSIEGERKRDWPPSQFYHHTWWKYYNYFTEYMGRLGHILSGGRHVAKVLIVWPINSIWTNYQPQKASSIMHVLENNFNVMTDDLLRLHFDYDYVDEDVLIEAQVKKNKILIANEDYDLIIMPPLTHIKKATFNKIKEFVKKGGKVIADTILPIEFLESDEKSPSAVKEIKNMFGLNPKTILAEVKGEVEPSKNKFTEGNVQFMHGKEISKDDKRIYLNKLLNTLIVPDVTIDNENVFYLHRIKDNYDIYFFTNVNQTAIGDVEISFEKIGKPELWNPNNGEIESLNIYNVKNNRLHIKLNFVETDSHIVIINNKMDNQYISESNLDIESIHSNKIVGVSKDHSEPFIKWNNGSVKKYKAEQKPALPAIKVGAKFNFKAEDDNVLCISNWKMKIADNKNNNFAKVDFNVEDWLNVHNGAWEMQLPGERDEEIYPVTLWYRTSFLVQTLPPNTRLMIDGFSGTSFSLFVNGKEIKDKGVRSKLDAEIKEVDIQKYIVEGSNIVAIKLDVVRRTDGILDLLKIIGDFSLEFTNEGYELSSPREQLRIGDWTKQGYPYYSGTCVYETEVNVPQKYLDGKLILHVDCGEDVLEVSINDSDSIVVPWHPYKVDITDFVKQGKNKVSLKVTNTLINILEAVKHPSGIFSQPRIEHHNKYEFFIDGK